MPWSYWKNVLTVNKDRIVAGLVKVGKHVVTEDRNIDVELEEERANIQRTNVDRPTDRRIGDADGNRTVEVELRSRACSRQQRNLRHRRSRRGQNYRTPHRNYRGNDPARGIRHRS